jgi:hypothetical protein
MDSQGGALLPLAACFRLRGLEARWGAVSGRGQTAEGTCRRARREPHFRVRWPIWTASSPNTGPKWVWRELVDLSTIFNRSTCA